MKKPINISKYTDVSELLNLSTPKRIKKKKLPPKNNFILLILAIALVGGSFFITGGQPETISTTEANQFKALVAAVAKCEDKTPQKIHSELQKAHNYGSYKHLNTDEYEAITDQLSRRVCK